MTGWTKPFFALVVVMGCLTLAVPRSRAADAAPASTSQLEVSANTAFNRGAYRTALPILRKLATAFADEPAKLGPVQEKIRVCERALTAVNAGPQVAPANLPPMTASTRKAHPVPKAGETLVMTIQELGNFEYDQDHGGNIPADVRKLNGVKIRLTGFMVPLDQAENITHFALVPSLFACCNFGGPPQIQHTVFANCPKGKAVGYCPDEIVVEGTLTVDEKKDDSYVVSVFNLEIASVKPAPK